MKVSGYGGCLKVAALVSSAFLFSGSLRAQDAEAEGPTEEEMREYLESIEQFGWSRNGAGDLDGWAEIAVASGYRFTGPEGARQLLEATGNIPGDSEAGILAPENLDWWVLFRFDKVGYVPDDEKDDIDATKLLRQHQKSQEASNPERVAMGIGELFVVDWAVPPTYNAETNNLEWAFLLRDGDGNESINYNTRLLGRHGVMEAILVCGPEELPEVLPVFQNLLTGFRYQEGKSYAEYQSGDMIAKYGLTALIAGAGVAGAAKLGLFAVVFKFFGKFWKLLVGGVVAIGVGLKKFFGGSKNPYTGS